MGEKLKSFFIALIVMIIICAVVGFFNKCPDTYMGAAALKAIRTDLIKKMIPHFIGSLWATFLFLWYEISVIYEFKDTVSARIESKNEYREYKKHRDDPGYFGIMDRPKGSVVLDCIKFFVAVITLLVFYIFLGFTFLPYSRDPFNDSDKNIFSKTKLIFDISSDIKNQETITEEYSSFYPSDYEENGTYYYMLDCKNGDTRMIFSIGEGDFTKLESEKKQFRSSVIVVEYYKKSCFLKSAQIKGKKFDSEIRTQEDMDMSYEKAEFSLENNVLTLLSDSSDYMGDSSCIRDVGWVIKRNGSLILDGKETPYTINALAYTKLDISEYIEEKGNYEIYLVKVVTPDDKEMAFRLSDSIEFTVE